MNTTTQPCAAGCTLRGTHLSTCNNTECQGCLPRPAEYGTLCAWDWMRLNSDIAEIPTITHHLLTNIATPHQPAWKITDTQSPGDPAERVNLHPATLAADELNRLLDSWITNIVDDHPAHLTGPKPGQHPTAWITPHLPWVAQQHWAWIMRTEITREVATLKARWPTPDMIERERHIPDIRCPRCNHTSLTYTPPTHYRQPFKVACQNIDCARVFSEDEWTRLVGLLAHAERHTA